MDKAKDFEKGWEEHKAKSKQEIEEMIGDIAKVLSGVLVSEIVNLAYFLDEQGYRKIPENAVVLTREEFEQLKQFEYKVRSGVCFTKKEWFDYINEDSNRRTSLQIKSYEKGIKETAEKFAEKVIDKYADYGDCDKIYFDRLRADIYEICKEFTGGEKCQE